MQLSYTHQYSVGEVCVGVLPSVIVGVLPSVTVGVLPSEFPPVSVRPSLDAFVRESSLPTVMFQSWLSPYEIDSSALPTSAYSRDGNIYEQRQYMLWFTLCLGLNLY